MPPYADMVKAKDGFEAVLALSLQMKGRPTYIPTLRSIYMPCLAASIAEDYNGSNAKDLALKYGFTERYVRKLIRQLNVLQ